MKKHIAPIAALVAVLAVPLTALAGLEPSPFISVEDVAQSTSYVLVGEGTHPELGRVQIYCYGELTCLVRTTRGTLDAVSADWVDQGHTADLDVVAYVPWGDPYVALTVEGVPWSLR